MIKKCIECCEFREHRAKGLCNKCYKKLRYANNPKYREYEKVSAKKRYYKNKEKNKSRYIICSDCKQRRINHAKTRCHKCYNEFYEINNKQLIINSKARYRIKNAEMIFAKQKAKIIRVRNAFYERYGI